MLKHRLIVNILWREIGVVQSRGYKHTNVVGDPKVAIECFNAWDADEILLLNVERSDRNFDAFLKMVRYVSEHCFLPLGVGGWINSLERVREVISNGADKVVINTRGLEDPAFLQQVSKQIGEQCVVASIDFRKEDDGTRQVYVNRGKDPLGINVSEAAKLAVQSGVGELILSSITQDGTLQGYDTGVIEEVKQKVSVPLILFGGVGEWKHLQEGLKAGADAVAAGNIFHFTEQSTRKAKLFLKSTDFPVR